MGAAREARRAEVTQLTPTQLTPTQLTPTQLTPTPVARQARPGGTWEVGSAGDPAEAAADLLADRAVAVLHGPGVQASPVRRSLSPAAAPVLGPAGGRLADGTPGLRPVGGRPLGAGVRGRMESALGADLAGVRVHTGPAVDRLGAAISADAYTVGRDVHLPGGMPDLSTPAGTHLLAHELAHTAETGSTTRRRVRRKLTASAGQALQTASGVNATRYGSVSESVDAMVPELNQDKIASAIVSKGVSTSQQGLDYADLLTAGALEQHVLALYGAVDRGNDYTSPRYAEIGAKRARDQYAKLAKVGPGTPAARTALRGMGLADWSGVSTDTVKADARDRGRELPRLEVRATGFGDSINFHLYLVYTSTEGDEFVLRGGGSEAGLLVVDVQRYKAGHVDYDTRSPSVLVAQGTKLSGKLEAMIRVAEQINASKVPYSTPAGVGRQVATAIGSNLPGKARMAAGEDCNAAAYTMLKLTGLPTQKPRGAHPGWGWVVGKQSGIDLAAQAPVQETEGPGARRLRLAVGAGLYHDRKMADKVSDLPAGTVVTELDVRDTRQLRGDGDTGRDKAYVKVGALKGWINIAKTGKDDVSDADQAPRRERVSALVAEGAAARGLLVVDAGSAAAVPLLENGKAIGQVADGQDVELLERIDPTKRSRSAAVHVRATVADGGLRRGDLPAGQLRWSPKDRLQTWVATGDSFSKDRGGAVTMLRAAALNRYDAPIRVSRGAVQLQDGSGSTIWVRLDDYCVATGVAPATINQGIAAAKAAKAAKTAKRAARKAAVRTPAAKAGPAPAAPAPAAPATRTGAPQLFDDAGHELEVLDPMDYPALKADPTPSADPAYVGVLFWGAKRRMRLADWKAVQHLVT